MSFRDTFKTLIHNKTNVEKIQKFPFLKFTLIDDAQRVIQAIPVTSETYEEAWALLKRCYDRPRFIIENHVKALINLLNCTKHSIRTFLDNVLLNVRTLNALGQPVHSWDTLSIQILLPKLEKQLREEWYETTSEVHLPKFDEFITKKSNTFESVRADSFVNKTENIHNKISNQKRVTLVENIKTLTRKSFG